LIIASVDFSHYLPEATAQANDQISIQTLQNWTWNRWDFRWLDVDCPSCLYLVNEIAIHKQSAQLYYRDSSSTILWKDMQSENTSRVFMYYEPYEQ
jgi:AmmeMemoRadiSam system protein B